MSSKYPYPYKLKTSEPQLQYEKFNGANFGYMLWNVPDGAERLGRVLLVHGFGEYTKIQYRLMDNLALHGFESFTFDQRGAGVTTIDGIKNPKGVTNEYHTFNDLNHFIELNLKQCKDLNIPLFMWGHSMGGGIILNYSCHGKFKSDISGYIASAPLIILHPHTRPNKITLLLSPMLAKWFSNTVIDTGLDLDGITSDPEYRKFLANDKPMSVPLYGSFRQIYDFMQRGKFLYRNKDNYIQKNCPKDVPVVIFHGKDDTINDPKGSKHFIDNCPAEDKLLKLYPKMRHSIFSLETDENFDVVFTDLLHWLKEHI